jgi:cobalamin biosynthesis protein CobD/CbiB
MATNASSLSVFLGTRYPFADPAMSVTLNGGERQPQYRDLKGLANLVNCAMLRAARFQVVASATHAAARAIRLDGTRNYKTFGGVTGCYG